MRKKLTHIRIDPLPNGYALTVGNNEYMFFDEDSLICGFFTHFGIKKTEYLDKEMVKSILEAAATWKTVGEAFEANAKLMAAVKRAQGEANAAYKAQSRANERAEKAEDALDVLKTKNIELEAELCQLRQQLKLMKYDVKPKSRPVMVDVEHVSRGRLELSVGKKKGKSRYARKD